MPEQSKVSRGGKAVALICSALHRAYRDVRFYPPGHPVAQQTLDALTLVLLNFIRDEDKLTLAVEEHRLVYQEEEVYSHGETRDNLAFIMFRDGLRTITFQSGLEQPEIESFVDCLARADELVRSDQDLVTVFWEQDYAHIEYEAADPFQSGGYLRQGTVDALRETVLHRLDEVVVKGAHKQAFGGDRRTIVPNTGVRADTLVLTPEELEGSETAAEGSANVLDDFAMVLLEVIGGAGRPTTDTGVVGRALTNVLEAYLQAGDLKAVNFLLVELQKLEAAARTTAGLPGVVITQAVTMDTIQSLTTGLGTAPPERVAEVETFLSTIREWTYPAQLELLAESPDRAVRRSLLTIMRKEGGVPAEYLEKWLGDPRWYVARNAAQLAATSRDPNLVAPLERLIRHADPRVRREAAHTLEGFGGSAALAGMTRALDDSDPTMRILAARGIAQLGGTVQEDLVAGIVLGRDFETRSQEEIEAMLLAYARLSKERAVPFLDKFWRRRLLRPRPLESRLAAIQALASIPGDLARQSLLQASKSGDGGIRRAAVRALQSTPSPQADS